MRASLLFSGPSLDVSNHFKGEFRQTLPLASSVVGATKWCVFRKITPTRDVVEAAVKERLLRMRGDVVDILQVFSFLHFHDLIN